MKLRDSRLWALIVAAAFAVLWLVSIGVAHSVPPQEPSPLPQATAMAPAVAAVGVSGWILVAVAALGILGWVVVLHASKHRRRSRPSSRPRIFQPSRRVTPARYSRTVVQRRYYR